MHLLWLQYSTPRLNLNFRNLFPQRPFFTSLRKLRSGAQDFFPKEMIPAHAVVLKGEWDAIYRDSVGVHGEAGPYNCP